MILALLIVVTNAQYRACVKAGACEPAAFDDPRSAATAKPENIEAYKKVSGGHQPAVGVSWNDANNYCVWAGKRLASLNDFNGGKSPAKGAFWVADQFGKKRLILEGESQRAEDPWARAPWLSFRCAE